MLRIKQLIGAALLLTMIGCAGQGGNTSGTAKTEDEIGLRKNPLVDLNLVLPQPMYSMKDPGESKKFARSFYDAPPMVPHTVDMAQGKDENECMDCHDVDLGDKETPPIPPSHRITVKITQVTQEGDSRPDYQMVEGHMATEGVDNKRFYCTQCHVPQATNLKPLEPNDFTAVTPGDAQQDILDQLNN